MYSARFTGEHADDRANNAKLVEELRRASAEESDADYRCALVFVDTDGREIVAEGRCDGIVRREARGRGGFGYDPYFYLPDGRAMAELTPEEKDRVSHRGRALRALVQQLEEYLR